MRKFFLMLILVIFLVGIQTFVCANGENVDVGNFLGMEEGEIYGSGIEYYHGKVTFVKEESNLRIGENTFENILPKSDDNSMAYIELDPSGKIIEANFITNNIGGEYVFGNTKLYAPPYSEVIFKGGELNLIVPENGIIEEYPDLIDSDVEGSITKISGEKFILPSGEIASGEIASLNDKFYVLQGSSAKIGDLKIIPTDENVELKLSSKSWITSIGEYFGFSEQESGNYVRISEEIEINGQGFEVEFNSEEYVKGEKKAVDPYLNSLSLENARNKKYYQLWDKGEDVKLIQKLVGVEQDGVFGEKTELALKKWQEENGLESDGVFGKLSLNKAKMPQQVIYKEIRNGLKSEVGVPVDLTLRDGEGEEISRMFEVEGPGFIETIKGFIDEGVQNKGYFTSSYKTSIHLNTVLFDDAPEPGSLTEDKGIIGNTLVKKTYVSSMQEYTNSLSNSLDPNTRFNLLMQKAGEFTNYDPEETLKLMSIFGSRYKDLSPNFVEGYGNRHFVNGESSNKYKNKIPPMSSKVANDLGLPQDPDADKKYRILTIAGQYLYEPEGFLKGTSIALEHTSYELLAFAGKSIREFKTGKAPSYGSGDTKDISADFAGVSFGEDLNENPEETLKNFDISTYFD